MALDERNNVDVEIDWMRDSIVSADSGDLSISLDVDSIGGGPPPTAEELRMISEAIKADREKRLRMKSNKTTLQTPSKPHR